MPGACVYAAPICGAKLVFPGPKLDGASIYELLDKEKVTLSAGVPTVWLALLEYCAQNKLKMSSVKRTLIGGSAVPLAMIERFWKEHGVEVAQGWGMTEMSPLGTITRFNKGERDLPRGGALRHHRQAGPAGVRLRDEDHRRRRQRPAERRHASRATWWCAARGS